MWRASLVAEPPRGVSRYKTGGENEKKEWAVGRVWVDSARGVLGGIPYRPGEKTLRAFLTGTRIS